MKFISGILIVNASYWKKKLLGCVRRVVCPSSKMIVNFLIRKIIHICLINNSVFRFVCLGVTVSMLWPVPTIYDPQLSFSVKIPVFV